MIEKIQIEWGNVRRTDALEKHLLQKSKKILKQVPEATTLIYSLTIENPINSTGVPEQKLDALLRLPNNQDIHATKRGSDLYRTVLDVQHAVLSQLKKRKSHKLSRRHDQVDVESDISA